MDGVAILSPPAEGSGERCDGPKVFHYFHHWGWPLLTLILLILDYHAAIGRPRPPCSLVSQHNSRTNCHVRSQAGCMRQIGSIADANQIHCWLGCNTSKCQCVSEDDRRAPTSQLCQMPTWTVLLTQCTVRGVLGFPSGAPGGVEPWSSCIAVIKPIIAMSLLTLQRNITM